LKWALARQLRHRLKSMSISWTTIRGREIIEGVVEEEYVGECAVQRSVSVDGTSANPYRRLLRI
jgi:hypothetical protein